jgi:hypothetical protein
MVMWQQNMCSPEPRFSWHNFVNWNFSKGYFHLTTISKLQKLCFSQNCTYGYFHLNIHQGTTWWISQAWICTCLYVCITADHMTTLIFLVLINNTSFFSSGMEKQPELNMPHHLKKKIHEYHRYSFHKYVLYKFCAFSVFNFFFCQVKL